MDEHIKRIAGKIAAGGRTVVFTGAGISTESGIPDYRSKGGLWDRFRPVYFDEFMSSRAARIEYWQRKTELYHDLVKAKPNAAHKALARLYAGERLEAVITQNIDGLHQKAGLPDDRVIELHGNTLRVRCMGCFKTVPLHEARRRIAAGDPAPECDCGGYLKPDTISFGQQLDPEVLERASDLAHGCDVFLVVGSTLVVHPAAQLPVVARQNGAFLAIVNLSETPCDELCAVMIRGKAGEVLPRIVEESLKKI